MGTRSEGIRNTTQSSCIKSSVVLNKFSNIVTHSVKLTIKQDSIFRLLLENANGLPPGMGYCTMLWKYKRIQHALSRFQVDVVCLTETQIKLSLILSTFSMRYKLLKNKEHVSILLQNKQEPLGMRQ